MGEEGGKEGRRERGGREGREEGGRKEKGGRGEGEERRKDRKKGDTQGIQLKLLLHFTLILVAARLVYGSVSTSVIINI